MRAAGPVRGTRRGVVAGSGARVPSDQRGPIRAESVGPTALGDAAGTRCAGDGSPSGGAAGAAGDRRDRGGAAGERADAEGGRERIMTIPPRVWVVIDAGRISYMVRQYATAPFHPADVEMFERHGAHVVEYILPPRWIPVGERLPEVGKPVLGFSGAAVFAVQLFHEHGVNRWRHAAPGQPWAGDITHW